MHEELSVVIGELKSLRCNVSNEEKMLAVAQADVGLQSLLREKSCKQLEAKIAELKVVQSQLELGDSELITLCSRQAKKTADLTQLQT